MDIVRLKQIITFIKAGSDLLPEGKKYELVLNETTESFFGRTYRRVYFYVEALDDLIFNSEKNADLFKLMRVCQIENINNMFMGYLVQDRHQYSISEYERGAGDMWAAAIRNTTYDFFYRDSKIVVVDYDYSQYKKNLIEFENNYNGSI